MEKKIMEGNAIIALATGATLKQMKEQTFYRDLPLPNTGGIGLGMLEVSELAYHRDWNWLIFAYHKIMDDIFSNAKDNHSQLRKYYSDMELFNVSIRDNNIGGAWFILTEAIKRTNIVVPQDQKQKS